MVYWLGLPYFRQKVFTSEETTCTPLLHTQAIDATADACATARSCLTLLSAPMHVVQCLVCCCKKKSAYN